MPESVEQHMYESGGLRSTCTVCGQMYAAEVHHVVPEGWCQWDEEDHDYQPGLLECRRCGAEEPPPEEDEDDE
jgi:hypothetical protein